MVEKRDEGYFCQIANSLKHDGNSTPVVKVVCREVDGLSITTTAVKLL